MSEIFGLIINFICNHIKQLLHGLRQCGIRLLMWLKLLFSSKETLQNYAAAADIDKHYQRRIRILSTIRFWQRKDIMNGKLPDAMIKYEEELTERIKALSPIESTLFLDRLQLKEEMQNARTKRARDDI